MQIASCSPTWRPFGWWFIAILVLLEMPQASQGAIRINEIHYHPTDEPVFDAAGLPVLDLSEDIPEFIGLINTSTNSVALGGWRRILVSGDNPHQTPWFPGDRTKS